MHDGVLEDKPGGDGQICRIAEPLEQGRTEHGLRLLGLAEGMTAQADRGILLSQRGLLLMRTWRIAEALRFFDAAVPLLDEPASLLEVSAIGSI